MCAVRGGVLVGQLCAPHGPEHGKGHSEGRTMPKTPPVCPLDGPEPSRIAGAKQQFGVWGQRE